MLQDVPCILFLFVVFFDADSRRVGVFFGGVSAWFSEGLESVVFRCDGGWAKIGYFRFFCN